MIRPYHKTHKHKERNIVLSATIQVKTTYDEGVISGFGLKTGPVTSVPTCIQSR